MVSVVYEKTEQLLHYDVMKPKSQCYKLQEPKKLDVCGDTHCISHIFFVMYLTSGSYKLFFWGET
jgi:hypothetical protein